MCRMNERLAHTTNHQGEAKGSCASGPALGICFAIAELGICESSIGHHTQSFLAELSIWMIFRGDAGTCLPSQDVPAAILEIQGTSSE